MQSVQMAIYLRVQRVAQDVFQVAWTRQFPPRPSRRPPVDAGGAMSTMCDATSDTFTAAEVAAIVNNIRNAGKK